MGAGPAGSAAACHAADRGYHTLLVEAESLPRDKTCGDGLTPRAMHELRALGLAGAPDDGASDITSGHRIQGLKLHGFGGSVTAPWPHGPFGTQGSAVKRAALDAALAREAEARGAQLWEASRATRVELSGGYLRSILVKRPGGTVRVRPTWVIVADGVRSPVGKQLGRTWHREEVYGIAARSYCATPRSSEPWIHSHLELRDAHGAIQPGYGWIFPLGDGEVNLGCGALSTAHRPAQANTKKLLSSYAARQRREWNLGPERHVASALLPMGGAVSGVAGPNWALIGDAAACVNPLNGEGIDYGLETARLAVELLGAGSLTQAWPDALRAHYGAAFCLARTLARALTHPGFLPAAGPAALRPPLGPALMPVVARLMGNLVSPEDRDVVARVWRAAGAAAEALLGGRRLWGPAELPGASRGTSA